MSFKPAPRIISFALLLVLGWSLSIFYGFLGRIGPPGWLSIAIVHSFAALVLWHFAKGLRSTPRWGARAFVPAALIVSGSILMALASRWLIDDAPTMDLSWDGRMLAFVFWIPLVEELVFRFGIGGLARQRLGHFWGAYGSALVFAMAHGSAGWGHLSLPVGPLLLGLLCEGLYRASGRLSAAIALHAACNASGWIFASLDERWLNWLQALYLKV